MSSFSELVRNTFSGSKDLERLREFASSKNLFDGDARWQAGTSLKAVWLSLHEFDHAQPIIEYWTDDQDSSIAGLISVWPDRWRMQAGPGHRDEANLHFFASRADALCSMLTTGKEIVTQAYSVDEQHSALEQLGYARGEAIEVFMTCDLEQHSIDNTTAPGLVISQYNPADPVQRSTRALIQADAFSGGEPPDNIVAWHLRNIDRMQMYSCNNIDFLATTENGESLAFASIQLDQKNNIAEIEPVGTRTKSQRQGLARLLLQRCLGCMKENGIKSAYIRTDTDNLAAISAYESVGFEITDNLFSYSKPVS